MPRIRCHYAGCVFLEEGYCSAAVAEIDPDEGCRTFSPEGEMPSDQAWRENEQLEEDWAEAGFGSSDASEIWADDEESDLPDDIEFDN